MNDELLSRLTEPELEGTVRLGTPEDFASSHLPRALSACSHPHPRVRLEITCELTRNLKRQFRRGRHDLIQVKREPMGATFVTRVWREPLVWVRGPHEPLAESGEVSLVVSPESCIYRERAIASLAANGRTWRIAYKSTSFAVALAAVRAGLGVTILPRDMVPQGFHVIEESENMSALPDVEIALLTRSRQPPQPVRRLLEHIVHALETT